MGELICKTEAKDHYGATDGDLRLLKPERTYFSRRKGCEVTLYEPSAVEAHLQARYGTLEECRQQADARRAKAVAATRERLFSPPAGWPLVGYLDGAPRWAAVDTETSGLDPATGCRCIEVAAVIVQDGRVAMEWSTRINPGPSVTWEEGATACNGICPEDLAAALTPKEAWSKFLSLTAGLPLVAHNAQFDRIFIEAELGTLGLQSQNSWYCTMGSRRRRLSSLYYDHARRWIDGQHTALGDAKAVAYLAPLVCR